MDIAKPLFEPRHRFAIGGKTKMSGLDNAGVDRTNRDLMEALAANR